MSKDDDKHRKRWPWNQEYDDEENIITPYDEFEDIRPVRDDWDNL